MMDDGSKAQLKIQDLLADLYNLTALPVFDSLLLKLTVLIFICGLFVISTISDRHLYSKNKTNSTETIFSVLYCSCPAAIRHLLSQERALGPLYVALQSRWIVDLCAQRGFVEGPRQEDGLPGVHKLEWRGQQRLLLLLLRFGRSQVRLGLVDGR